MTENGRQYLVADMVLLKPGVLAGSQGALFYPLDEVARNPGVWNQTKITLGHPVIDGKPVSVNHPRFDSRYVLGVVRNDRWDKSARKRRAEGWFDVQRTEAVAPELVRRLRDGTPTELSTGLLTDNHPVENGASFEGRPYVAIARDYRPDHLAILPDRVGACSLSDGCGVLANEINVTPQPVLSLAEAIQLIFNKGAGGGGKGGGGKGKGGKGCVWRTILHSPVCIGSGGKIEMGPSGTVGKSPKDLKAEDKAAKGDKKTEPKAAQAKGGESRPKAGTAEKTKPEAKKEAPKAEPKKETAKTEPKKDEAKSAPKTEQAPAAKAEAPPAGASGLPKEGEVRKPLKEKDVPPHVRKQEEKIEKNLTPADKKALDAYTSESSGAQSKTSYAEINKKARQCPQTMDCLDKDQKEVFERINKMANQKLDEPVTTYRGMSVKGETKEKLLEQAREAAKSGGTMQFHGVQSSSIDPEIGGGYGSGGVVLEVRTKTGAYVDGVSKTQGEKEFIMPHNKKYKVVGVQENQTFEKAGKATVIQMEEVD